MSNNMSDLPGGSSGEDRKVAKKSFIRANWPLLIIIVILIVAIVVLLIIGLR